MPQKQSDMRGYTDMKKVSDDSVNQQLENSLENKVPSQENQNTMNSDNTVPSSPVQKEMLPKANSTPKMQKYIIVKQKESVNEEDVPNEERDESLGNHSHPSSEPSENLTGDPNTDKDNNEDQSMEIPASPGASKLNSSSDNQEQNGSGSDDTNAPPSNEQRIPDKDFDILFKGMQIIFMDNI